jgi:hypothetical protein
MRWARPALRAILKKAQGRLSLGFLLGRLSLGFIF